ncbi:Protein CBG18017 [Caenorhabditis briggsae]|uniref:Protein CBG18017 n=1 Tax=Caenorhabditis briggsae TaxID=6238 RepID=A8XSU3_CAEBR|nr:Protein CBG18017 [Caenorhabditis briggsae]CAP35545.1 Protein CBG18017 [Caenorhabditis briggsae]
MIMFMFMLLMLLSSTSAHKGRPQRHTIVQPSELRPVEAIANLPELTSRNIADFIGNIDGTEESDEAALRFLATYGLVPNERECPECLNGKMSLVKDNALPLHFVWRCSSCKTSNIITKKMIRENTFFQEQKLSVQKIVHIAADWVESPGRNNERTASLHGVTTSTIVNLNKLFRQLTEQWFERQIEKNSNFLLGGPGKIVEIDESHMYKAKYNRGHMLRRKSIWIFGMTERHTNKVAMFRVKQRDAATLLPIIRAHVKPGSMIVSDGWAAYGGIRTLQRAFTHRWVNHKVNFVDPSDRRVHTQSIEATWGAFKRELKAKYGVPEDQLDGYMSTYMFRRYFGRKKLLNHLLIEMKYYKKEDDSPAEGSSKDADKIILLQPIFFFFVF